jgi:hypothetical protein
MNDLLKALSEYFNYKKFYDISTSELLLKRSMKINKIFYGKEVENVVFTIQEELYKNQYNKYFLHRKCEPFAYGDFLAEDIVPLGDEGISLYLNRYSLNN